MFSIVPRVHKIARMHQNISGGKTLYSVVESVGVGDYYKAHWLTLSVSNRMPEWRSTSSVAINAKCIRKIALFGG
jgi:hypothetical protein